MFVCTSTLPINCVGMLRPLCVVVWIVRLASSVDGCSEAVACMLVHMLLPLASSYGMLITGVATIGAYEQ